MIILENVSKYVISNMTLHIPKGECVGIIGASGAGKTTLLKIISGLLDIDEGGRNFFGKIFKNRCRNSVKENQIPEKSYVQTYKNAPVFEKSYVRTHENALAYEKSYVQTHESAPVCEKDYVRTHENAPVCEKSYVRTYENAPVCKKSYVRTLGKNPVQAKGSYGKDLSVFLTGKSNLQKEDSVKTNLEMTGKVYRMTNSEFQEQYKYLSKRFAFDTYEEESVGTLSLGQRMRVELGAAFLMNPKLLLLDEPDIGLDENGKAALWETIEEKRKNGMTIVVTSHSPEHIVRYCTRILLIEHGEILFYGSAKRIYSSLASIDTMIVKTAGILPDLEDLPLHSYGIKEDTLRVTYDSNYLSAAEIIGLILKQTQIEELQIQKPKLGDIIMQLKGECRNESHRGKKHQ